MALPRPDAARLPAEAPGGAAGARPGPAVSPARTLHATTVARHGRALLIRGPAGSGKSALALELIARGAVLVADDRTVLTSAPGGPAAAPPPAIAGLIEARGVGLLRLPWAGGVPLAAVVDLADPEPDRVPPRRTTVVLGHEVTLYRRVEGAHFPAALLLALAHPPLDPDAPLQEASR